MLSGGSLGSFQRIDLVAFCFGFFLNMGGKVAGPVSPFHRWFRESSTIPSRSKLNRAIAAITLINNFMADAPVIGTSLGRHERTRLPAAYSCAVHWNHPLLMSFFIAKRPGSIFPRPDLSCIFRPKYNGNTVDCQWEFVCRAGKAKDLLAKTRFP